MKAATLDNIPKKEGILSKNPVLRYLSFSGLYMAQGLTDGTWLFTIPAWLAMNGASATEIGAFVAIAGLPWSFKIIIAHTYFIFLLKQQLSFQV